MNQELLSPAALSREFGVNNMAVGQWLLDAQVPVVASMPHGRGTMRLYDPETARRAIRDRMAADQPKPPPAPDADSLEELRAAVDRLQEQNRVMFAFIRDNVAARLDKIADDLGVKP